MVRCKKAVGAWLLTVVAGAAAVAWAFEAGSASGGEPVAGLVGQLRENGAAVTALGKTGGLEGWWVQPADGQGYALYVDESGHAVIGALYAPDGSGLTSAQLKAVRTAPAASPPPVGTGTAVTPATPERTVSPAGVLEVAPALEGFDLGASGPQVAVFADPACLPSRVAVARLARRAVDGEIRLRVVPVAVLGEASWAMAGEVLDSDDRVGAWFGLDRKVGRDVAQATMGPEVSLNGRVLERSGTRFVPYSLMRGADGSVSSVTGPDFTAWFGAGG